tara:strand:+ start:410 stop:805 length:396 start_codon:yes stop_codon:yes gene_type:complete
MKNIRGIGFIKTFIVCLYDWMLVFSVLFFLSFPFVFLNEGNDLIGSYLYQVYVFIIIFSYYCWFWIRHKQTLGMKSWKVIIRNLNNDEPVTLSQCLIRMVFALLGGHVLLVFYKHSLQDIISGTYIIKKID